MAGAVRPLAHRLDVGGKGLVFTGPELGFLSDS